MDTKAIEVENLSFRYGSEPVFQGIRFSLALGDIAALIGSNGTGKSTLLKIMLGELPPSTGSVRLLGQDVRKFRDWPKVGYVPQNHAASGFPATALEIVKANLYSQIGLMRMPRRVHTQKAMHALELAGMAEHAGRLIGDLSGGQQQRVMLAGVLVNDPAVMLLDEPTTGIDEKAADSLYALLQDLNQKMGLTVLMVTHDVSRASCYAQRVFCLEHGSLMELERNQVMEEICHRHQHPALPPVPDPKEDAE
jgi:zinc transport system ATP-binding protein